MEQYLDAKVKRYVQRRLFSKIGKAKTILGLAGTHPDDIKDTLKKLPEEIAKKALSSAMAAGILRKEGPGPAALKAVLKMIADSTEKE